jgi:mono/diheme cytochrome c family protein
MHHDVPVVNLGMNKEVNYVLQGFLLTLVVIGAYKFGGYLLSIPPPPEEPKEVVSNVVKVTEPILSPLAITGKTIFLNNCASCHSLTKEISGPRLQNVQQRLEKKVIYAWIRNPAAVLKSGDPYFNRLVNQFGVMMTGFPNLTDGEIEALLEYFSKGSPQPQAMP